MTQRKLVVANWKMNKGSIESAKFAEEIKSFIINNNGIRCDIVICPPFIAIETVNRILKDTDVKVGAQNCFYESSGAYTGEISCSMLKSWGASYVIIGHSERRQYFNESNEIVSKKLLKACDEGLIPILCVGETQSEHEDQITEAVIKEQIEKCLINVSIKAIKNIVLAYEPIWAIGTGKNATPHQAELVHNFIRKKIKKLYDEVTSQNIRILYGGSITPMNSKELFSSDTISGGLVGGASLDEKKFIEIINSTP